MTETGYKNRVLRYLKRDKVKASKEDVTKLVEEHFGKTPPSVAALKLHPKATPRGEKKELAEEKFDKVLNESCKVFELVRSKAKTGDDENWKDLRSAAAYIGLKKLKIRPASAMADSMGLPSPAAVYHAATRAEKLLVERTLFKQAVEKICKQLKAK